MKQILLLSGCIFLASALLAQDSTYSAPKKNERINLANRSNDHFLIQLGYTGWNGIPDTINTKGLSKSVNIYFMFDFPFKTNPKMSMAFGPGISTDQILFSKTYVGIKDLTPQIYFTDQADTNHFKKTKLATAYLEAPIELRYSANPYTGKGLKLALGVKVGTLLNAHTRNTKYQNAAGASLNDYVQKEASKKFFNKNRLSGMVRVGYGHFSLYGTYQFTTLFKDGFGPVVRPFSIGITLSGL
jgi:hypothetical protein